MNVFYRAIGAIAHNLVERTAPVNVHARSMLAAEALAEAEANEEAWPPLADWERELRDAFLEVDTADQPAGVGKPTPPNGDDDAGGSLISDEIATVIAVVLRGQGINSAAIYADLVARELRHHFEIFRK